MVGVQRVVNQHFSPDWVEFASIIVPAQEETKDTIENQSSGIFKSKKDIDAFLRLRSAFVIEVIVGFQGRLDQKFRSRPEVSSRLEPHGDALAEADVQVAGAAWVELWAGVVEIMSEFALASSAAQAITELVSRLKENEAARLVHADNADAEFRRQGDRQEGGGPFPTVCQCAERSCR